MSATDGVFALQSLIQPLTREQFFAEYWKRKPHFLRASEVLDRAIATLGTLDVPTLVSESDRISIWPRERNRKPVTIAGVNEALRAYETENATLYFDPGPQNAVRSALFSVAAELGEPIPYVHLFAVKSGGGTRPHFDRNQSFTVQLKGRKQWTLASNTFIEFPVSNWGIGDEPPYYVDPTTCPVEMPSGTTVVLEPGSVLYTPRGILHQTAYLDGDESLSLNFVIQDLCWIDMVLAILREKLVSNVRFREGLTGVFGGAWGRPEFISTIPDRVRELSAALSDLKAPDFMKLIDRPDDLKVLLRSLAVDTGFEEPDGERAPSAVESRESSGATLAVQ